MNCLEKELLDEMYGYIPFSKLQVGDIVRIGYDFDSYTNTILITNIFETSNDLVLKAIWYEEDEYKGKNYTITKNQVIHEIIEREFDVDELIEQEVRKYEKETRWL